MVSCNDHRAVIDSPIPGVPSLEITLHNGELSGIAFLYQARDEFISEEMTEVVTKLRRYLQGQRIEPESTAQLKGTPFQHRVWQALCRIPFGRVCSYGELATQLNSGPRAVAAACRANPLPLLVPCHRVVSATGLGGYMGQTAGQAMEIKQWLLQHEGSL